MREADTLKCLLGATSAVRCSDGRFRCGSRMAFHQLVVPKLCSRDPTNCSPSKEQSLRTRFSVESCSSRQQMTNSRHPCALQTEAIRHEIGTPEGQTRQSASREWISTWMKSRMMLSFSRRNGREVQPGLTKAHKQLRSCRLSDCNLTLIT